MFASQRVIKAAELMQAGVDELRQARIADEALLVKAQAVVQEVRDLHQKLTDGH